MHLVTPDIPQTEYYFDFFGSISTFLSQSLHDYLQHTVVNVDPILTIQIDHYDEFTLNKIINLELFFHTFRSIFLRKIVQHVPEAHNCNTLDM